MKMKNRKHEVSSKRKIPIESLYRSYRRSMQIVQKHRTTQQRPILKQVPTTVELSSTGIIEGTDSSHNNSSDNNTIDTRIEHFLSKMASGSSVHVLADLEIPIFRRNEIKSHKRMPI